MTAYFLDTFQVLAVTPTRAPSYSAKALVPKVKAAAGCRQAARIWPLGGDPYRVGGWGVNGGME